LTGGPHKSGGAPLARQRMWKLISALPSSPFWWKDDIHCDWPGFARHTAGSCSSAAVSFLWRILALSLVQDSSEN